MAQDQTHRYTKRGYLISIGEKTKKEFKVLNYLAVKMPDFMCDAFKDHI